eukprot:s749_g2.t1
MSKSSESKPPPSLRNLVSQLVDRATQRRQRRSEISREVRNEQLKRCATVLCSEACQDFAVEELNIWFQVAKQKGTHELKALLYLVDLILSRHVREVKKRKDDAALEKVAKGCIGENGQFLALRLLEYVEHKMCSRKNWRECKDFIKDLAYKWESYGFFRSPLVKKAVCQILWDLGAHDHMNPETQISKQRTRPPGDIMVPKLPHFDRDRTHFFAGGLLQCGSAEESSSWLPFQSSAAPLRVGQTVHFSMGEHEAVNLQVVKPSAETIQPLSKFEVSEASGTYSSNRNQQSPQPLVPLSERQSHQLQLRQLQRQRGRFHNASEGERRRWLQAAEERLTELRTAEDGDGIIRWVYRLAAWLHPPGSFEGKRHSTEDDEVKEDCENGGLQSWVRRLLILALSSLDLEDLNTYQKVEGALNYIAQLLQGKEICKAPKNASLALRQWHQLWFLVGAEIAEAGEPPANLSGFRDAKKRENMKGKDKSSSMDGIYRPNARVRSLQSVSIGDQVELQCVHCSERLHSSWYWFHPKKEKAYVLAPQFGHAVCTKKVGKLCNWRSVDQTPTESLLCSDADRQERYEAFVRAMHADNEKESERARAMEKRRCERLGRKPRSPEEIQALQEELREKLETELAKWPGRPMKSSSGAEKLKPKVKPVERTLGQKVEPYAAEFHFLAANFPERAEPQSGEAAKSLAPREPAEKPASARVSGTQKVAEAAKSPAPREPAEKPASARVSGTQKVAEAAKSPAPREPAEKPASARIFRPFLAESAASSRGVKRPAESETDASEKRSRTSDDSKAPAPTNVPRKIKWKGGSLKVWPVLGDHRCLFRAVVRGVFDRYNKVPRDDRGVPLDQFTAAMETRKADIVRKALCDYMQLNKARVEPCMEPPGSDATQYIQSMRDPTTWADQICTKFLPEVIKCPIHVQAWNHKKKCLYDVGVHLPSQGMDTKRGAVFLYYNGRAHYELVCLQHLLKKERALQNQTVSSSSSYEYDSSSSE